MSFRTRWDDADRRPTVREALRDAAVRAVLPGLLLLAVITGFGLLLTGPLWQYEDRENAVARWFQDRRTPTGETVTLFMSSIGNTEYVIGVAVLVAGIVWWRTKRWWYAVVPVLAISLQASIFVTAAAIVGRSRPNVERLDPTPPTSSFPSGHVGASTALYLTLALMAARLENVVARRVLVALCVSAPVMVGYARMYRGAHNPTDVLWAYVNGAVCALLAWGYLRLGTDRPSEDAAEPAGQIRA